MKKIILLLLLLILLGSASAYLAFFADTVPEEQNIEEEQKNEEENISDIVVTEQKPGLFVTASLVRMPSKGFAVVYENDSGDLGRVIGNSKLLPAGESVNAVIGLIRNTVPGESLFIVLHSDSGDGVFTPSIDTPIKDDENNLIYAGFYIGSGGAF